VSREILTLTKSFVPNSEILKVRLSEASLFPFSFFPKPLAISAILKVSVTHIKTQKTVTKAFL
jgi:hypothetical protein